MAICKECKNRVTDEDRFCSKCGAVIEREATLTEEKQDASGMFHFTKNPLARVFVVLSTLFAGLVAGSLFLPTVSSRNIFEVASELDNKWGAGDPLGSLAMHSLFVFTTLIIVFLSCSKRTS